MILDKAILQSFNTDSTIVIFGSYPNKGHIHDKNVDALASFTKNRVTGLNPTNKNKVIVITHSVGDEKTYEKYKDLLILRIFHKDSPSSFLHITNFLNKVSKVKKILIEYEFSTFGGNKMTLAFIPFLISLKNNHYNITIELHQVLTDLNKLKGHLGYKNHDIRATIFNNALGYFYTTIGKVANKFIVLEHHLKEKLSQFIPDNKIHFLPHGVQKMSLNLSQIQAKKRLKVNQDDFVVLMFGYLTWYKGSDIFIKAALKNTNKKIKFIIAGGPSHNQKHKIHYQKWYQTVIQLLQQDPKIIHTDFVKEEDISTYYQAADLVVFPYRTFMSSSGPLSIAFSHHKPFLLSHRLSPYLKSPDIRDSLLDESFSKNVLFEPNPTDLLNKISYLQKKTSILNHLKTVSIRIANKRLYTKLGQKQRQIIDQ